MMVNTVSTPRGRHSVLSHKTSPVTSLVHAFLPYPTGGSTIQGSPSLYSMVPSTCANYPPQSEVSIPLYFTAAENPKYRE